jgi:Ig-like domain CHU_C associated
MGGTNAPPAPAVTSTVTHCQNGTATPLTATPLAGHSLKWYTAATGGTGSATAPTPATAAAGSTLHYVSQSTAGGCEGPRAVITVVVNAAPVAPGTSPVTYCQNVTAAALTATAATGNTLKWYTTATGGTGSATAPTPSTTVAGSVTYYVSQTSALGCEGARAALMVTTNPAPVLPTIVTPVAYCQNTVSTILSATAATGNSLNWYNTATGGFASAIPPTPVTTVVGAQAFYVSQTNSLGCESPRAAIAVNINALPAVPVLTASPYTRLFPGLTTVISTTNTPATTFSWFRNGLLLAGQSSNSVSANINWLGNYTVMAINAAGCSRMSNALTIADSVQVKLFAYPNPSKGKFEVRFYSPANDLQPRLLVVYDDKGTRVFSTRQVMFGAFTSMPVDLSGMSAGTYTIYLTDNGGKKLASGQVVIGR